MIASMQSDSLLPLLEKAVSARESFMDAEHVCAIRLFNGFSEGFPDLVIDLFGKTAVLHDYSELTADKSQIGIAERFLQSRFEWIQAIVLKSRRGGHPADKTGTLIYGKSIDRKIKEHGVWYQIDLTMNQDTSFYLDMNPLRKWAIQNLAGKTVFNTFAYTGSLGVAALAGGATRVLQSDLNRTFLNVAKDSYSLNRFSIQKSDFYTGDFWSHVKRLKQGGERFDCVFLDPPFFATSKKGTIDLETNSLQLINKVRPLISHNGYLVAVNNAVFLSGKSYMETLDQLCEGGYVTIDRLIDVPADYTGYPDTRVGLPPQDPAPFNHSTKIAVLKLTRKDAV